MITFVPVHTLTGYAFVNKIEYPAELQDWVAKSRKERGQRNYNTVGGRIIHPS
jgi:hypothetical protein